MRGRRRGPVLEQGCHRADPAVRRRGHPRHPRRRRVDHLARGRYLSDLPGVPRRRRPRPHGRRGAGRRRVREAIARFGPTGAENRRAPGRRVPGSGACDATGTRSGSPDTGVLVGVSQGRAGTAFAVSGAVALDDVACADRPSATGSARASTGVIEQLARTIVTSTSLRSSTDRIVLRHVVVLTATVASAPSAGIASFTMDGATIAGCGAVRISDGAARCAFEVAKAGAVVLRARVLWRRRRARLDLAAADPSSDRLARAARPRLSGAVVSRLPARSPRTCRHEPVGRRRPPAA